MKILSVGRIAPIKNYEVLIEAARILKQRNINFSVIIVGEPALEQDRAYEKHLRLESAGLNFQFLGKKTQPELADIYRSHDVFVHMSQTGSLDKTLLEAMSCGMRVLSCNDAAKGLLPSQYIFHDALDLSEKITHTEDINFNGREYVLEHHDLGKLITKLSALL